MLKIGLLGCGMIGNVHVDGFLSLNSKIARFTSVCDIDIEKRNKFAQKYGLRAFADLDEMLNDPEIDVVDLCLPSFMHEEYAVKIARARKHLLIEKPIAFTLEAARNIFATAHENDIRMMVAQVIRFWPEYVKIKEICDSGKLGDIVTIYAARLGQMVTWVDWYKDPTKSGETLLNFTQHDIDFLHYLLGKPVSVYSSGTCDANDNYNDVMNIFRFECGTNALVDGSLSMTAGYPFTMRMRVLGTKGTLEFLYTAGENIGPESISSLMWYRAGEKGEKVEVENYDPYGKEIEYFAQCIVDGKDTETVSEQSVMQTLTSILVAKESLTKGEIKFK
jgi:predicted dehydrogenase